LRQDRFSVNLSSGTVDSILSEGETKMKIATNVQAGRTGVAQAIMTSSEY